MLSIHRVAHIEARVSDTPGSNWLTLTFTEPDGETQSELTIYCMSRASGFAEEHRFVQDLAAAINSVTMEIGEWPSAETSNQAAPGDLGSVPLAALQAQFEIEGKTGASAHLAGAVEPPALNPTEADEPEGEHLYPGPASNESFPA